MKREAPTFDAARPTVERLLQDGVTSYAAVEEGGYSPTGRWLIQLEGGRSAFVKAELQWSDSHGLSREYAVYSGARARSLPVMLGYHPGSDGSPRVLVTEDLSAARWGTPLDVRDVELLADALDELADVIAPAGLPDTDLDGGWDVFAVDPTSLIGTGLVDESWAQRHLPELAAVAATVDQSGDRLLHTDLWLQNWCRADRGAVLVDWAGAGAGSPALMRAFAEAGVRAAGGPPGLLMSGHAGWAAWMAGLAATYLSEEGPDVMPRLLETERREAVATLRWACAELDLPEPPLSPVLAALGPWRP